MPFSGVDVVLFTFQPRFALLAALCCSFSVQATNIDLPRTDGDIVIDGRMDEDAWRNAVQVELAYENEPGDNLPARVKTVAYLVEDGANLYVGFAASDPEPSAIRAYLRDRDAAYDDDFVGIVSDTYNDNRRAFEFFSNPLGVQMDMTLNEAAQHGKWNKEDDSWDAIWDSAGQINDDGYAVEMKIPLTQLRFPAGEGLKTWGFDVTRTYPRSSGYRFSSVPLERGVNCYLCQIGEFSGLENAEPGRDLEIVPTLTASGFETSEDPGFEPMASDSKSDVGLSARWGITPDLTANLAINPDFSQIEADVAQLAVNNRFALFFPEKRPFFLEGADYFSTPLNAVFTRTISDPDVGAKLTGKRGDNTFGLIAAQDAITNILFPGQFGSDNTTVEQSNTAFIGRYSRGFGDTSSVGGVLTVRDGDGYHNYVGGFDARWKISDRHTLSGQYLESDTEYPVDVAEEFEQPLGAFDGNAIIGRYDYDSRNWSGGLRYTDSSEGFRADSGFQSQVGINKMRVDGGRVWHGEEEDWWTRIRLRADYSIDHLEDGTFVERDVGMRLSVVGPMQSWVQISFETGSELENGIIFDKQEIGYYINLTPRRGLSLEFYAQTGDQIDYSNTRLGDQVYLQPSVKWNINRNFLLDLRSIFASLDTKDGEKIFDASVVDARMTWQFSVRSFVRVSLQHSETTRNPDVYIDEVDTRSKDVGRQLLYSYKINPQTVFFLGYADQYVDEDRLEHLTASDRSVFMKIGYAWNL
jgi:hypothetical protein